jgi:hypothetical protein
MNYTYFVLLRAKPAWLSLSREARSALANQHLRATLAQYQGRLTMRYFDAEAFSAPCSDVMMIETPRSQAPLFLHGAIARFCAVQRALFRGVEHHLDH